MLFGQQYNGNGKISDMASYIQFDICGLSPIEIVQKYFLYEIDKPIILFGDYEVKERNISEDDMLKAERIYEIKDVIDSLKAFGAEIIGLTLMPVSRLGLKKFGSEACFKDYIEKLNTIYPVPVFIKNTNRKELFLSNPEEVIDFTKDFYMTFDGSELHEVCSSDKEYRECYKKINWNNIKELHIRYAKIENGTIHRPKERDEVIDINSVIDYLKLVPYGTFLFTRNLSHVKFDALLKGIIDKLK